MKSALLVALCAAVVLLGCERNAPQSASRTVGQVKSRTTAVGLMSSDANHGYARAVSKRPFVFPEDHGPHPDFRTEWWYFTGNLRAQSGRRFGFQLTLFRFALAPAQAPAQVPRQLPGQVPDQAPEQASEQAAASRASRFATRQAWMGHFALSDPGAKGDSGAAGQFHAFERLERGAAGLAGAVAQPFRVWLRDWQVSSGPDGLFPLRLRAAQSGISLDLQLQRGKPLVLQGDAGLSRKSGDPGNASYYYSYTRLPAVGRVQTVQGDFQVSGQAWLDREWSSSALAADQTGWDWFALHLSDGRDLMVYRLRDANGATHPYSAGVLVDANGSVTPITAAQMEFEPGRTWRSPDGEHYPVAWRLQVGELQLEVSALLDGQAHRGRFRYWEGAVRASGTDGSAALSAEGYLEMTGY